MNEIVFQDVFDRLQDCLPEKWENVILYVAYTTGSYSMKYYSNCGNGEFVDCFKQEGVNKAQLIKLFMGIDKILAPERKALDDKNRWTVMTMIVNKTGEMKTEFDYKDISESAIEYEQEWKKKYL